MSLKSLNWDFKREEKGEKNYHYMYDLNNFEIFPE